MAASPLDRLARATAGALARGLPPPVEEIAALFDERPEALIETLDGLVRRLATPRDDDALAAAYAALLGLQLQQLRFYLESDFADAKALHARFEERVAGLMRAGGMPPLALMDVSREMRAARLRPGPALRAASVATMTAEEASAEGEPADGAAAAPLRSDVEALLQQVSADAGDDPYAVNEAFAEMTYLLPLPVRPLLVEAMVQAPAEVLRDVAVLALLDPEPEARRGAAAALAANAAALTPAGLRRLATIRAWLPEDERAILDRALEAARREAAPWAPGPREVEIRASLVDGSSAQSFLLATPAGKRRRLSSVMVRHGVGVLDAWSGEPEAKGSVAASLETAGNDMPMRRVARPYLDRAVGRALRDGMRLGAVPSTGLLQVAEMLGAADWRPVDIEWRAALAALLEAVPAAMRTPESAGSIAAASAEWGTGTGLADSWFEDDPTVQDVLARCVEEDFETRIQRVLDEVIEPRKAKWAERFSETALWLKEGATPDPDWARFAILAQELAAGRRAADTPLLEEIAVTTIEAAEGGFADELPW
jgi:hypothetical protein